MVVLAFLICYAFAYRPFMRQQYNLSLCIIVICGLLIKIWACSDPWLHDWDERYHALVAKNLLQHMLKPTLYDTPLLPYDYKNWTGNHIWVHKQPVTLWLIAVSLKIFGIHAFAVRIPSILLSSLSTILIYKVGKEWFSDKVGIIAAFLLSINGLIIDLVSGNNNTDHVDIIFFALVLLAVWLTTIAINRKSAGFNVLVGLVLGLSILTKWLPALVVIPIWLILAAKAYQGQLINAAFHLFILLSCALMVALPWQLFIMHAYPLESKWEYYYNALHFTDALEGHDGNWLYHLNMLRILYGETVYLPIAWFIYTSLKRQSKSFLVLSVWFLVPYIFFSISATKMPAYTLLASPAIFLMTSVFFWKCIDLVHSSGKYKFLPVLTAISLLGLPVRYCVERLKPFDPKPDNKTAFAKVLDVEKSIKDPAHTVVFNYPNPIELMFYTGCNAYAYKPNDSTIRVLKADRYIIIIQ